MPTADKPSEVWRRAGESASILAGLLGEGTMGRLHAVMASLLAVCLHASIGHAETKVIAKAGSWQAFGGTARDGTGVCGISAEVGNRYFGLKQFAGQNSFDIQMSEKTWQLAKDQKVGLTLQYDTQPTWRATATAFRFDDGDPGIEFAINRSELDRFRREFRDSSLMLIRFGGLLPEWRLGLEGTSAMNGPLENCIRSLK